jgi:hypothetical protein
MDHNVIAPNTRNSSRFGATGKLELPVSAMDTLPKANSIGAAAAVYFIAERE